MIREKLEPGTDVIYMPPGGRPETKARVMERTYDRKLRMRYIIRPYDPTDGEKLLRARVVSGFSIRHAPLNNEVLK